jgi:hypothetical protein
MSKKTSKSARKICAKGLAIKSHERSERIYTGGRSRSNTRQLARLEEPGEDVGMKRDVTATINLTQGDEASDPRLVAGRQGNYGGFIKY